MQIIPQKYSFKISHSFSEGCIQPFLKIFHILQYNVRIIGAMIMPLRKHSRYFKQLNISKQECEEILRTR